MFTLKKKKIKKKKKKKKEKKERNLTDCGYTSSKQFFFKFWFLRSRVNIWLPSISEFFLCPNLS